MRCQVGSQLGAFKGYAFLLYSKASELYKILFLSLHLFWSMGSRTPHPTSINMILRMSHAFIKKIFEELYSLSLFVLPPSFLSTSNEILAI